MDLYQFMPFFYQIIPVGKEIARKGQEEGLVLQTGFSRPLAGIHTYHYPAELD